MKIDKLLSDIKYILEVAPILMTRANYNKILDIVFLYLEYCIGDKLVQKLVRH